MELAIEIVKFATAVVMLAVAVVGAKSEARNSRPRKARGRKRK